MRKKFKVKIKTKQNKQTKIVLNKIVNLNIF